MSRLDGEAVRENGMGVSLTAVLSVVVAFLLLGGVLLMKLYEGVGRLPRPISAVSLMAVAPSPVHVEPSADNVFSYDMIDVVDKSNHEIDAREIDTDWADESLVYGADLVSSGLSNHELENMSTEVAFENEAFDDDVLYYGDRPLRKVGTRTMVVTAYSPDARSCGKWADGITASGKSVWTNGMKLVAADKRLFKFGTILTVPGYNGERPVPVLDRGGAIKGNKLDVLYPTHEIAKQWGVQKLEVTVWEYAD
ncbi:3D domain-containing protein [Poriferisphaera sp. WC338]|uniref:3D domain-containing protein n=1 Tax=Poriferisphaera sp. WC338 TaxID=3425129 RepID=UPI003D8126F1